MSRHEEGGGDPPKRRVGLTPVAKNSHLSATDPIVAIPQSGIVRRMKASEKKQRLANATATYLRQIGRKAQKGAEPNDRAYDRKLDHKLKRMRPEDVDSLFRGEDD